MIGSLRCCPLYEESEVFIFVDGPRDECDREAVAAVTDFAHTITPHVFSSPLNKGLGASIIAGVTTIIRQYGRAIVLEDDLRLMPGFLLYMNESLDRYQNDKRIIAACGYGLKVKRPKDYTGDVYLGERASSWGWGTWADRWNAVDWEVKDFQELASNKADQKAFNRGGSDMYGMLKDYMEGRNHSWAIRFCYAQYRQGLYSVHPFKSLVTNEGYGVDATNCTQSYSRFKVELSDAMQFEMPKELMPDEQILRQVRWYHSIPLRIYSKIRKILNL